MKHFWIICLVGIVILISETNLFAQWEPDVRLTFDNASSHIYYNNAWQIAAIGDTVHVVWCDKRDGNCENYYKRSDDGGTTWGMDTRLTYNPGTQCAPGIAVSGSYVHVVWPDYRNGNYEIYYKRSTDGGTTWGIDTKISNGPTTVHQPSIAVSGSYVHVVWRDNRHGDAEVYYNRSTDGGTTWGIDTRLTDTLSVYVWFPSVAVLDSNIHVVWDDDRDGNREIYYKRNPTGNIGVKETENLKLQNRNWKLTFYPNPFTIEVSIKCSGISEKQEVTLEIHDASGRLVKSVPLTTNHLSLGTDLQPGIYFLKLNGKPVGKVVKVK